MAADSGAARKTSGHPGSRSASLAGMPVAPGRAGAVELDRLIHERVRLGIVSALAVNGWVTFTDLRDLLGITDGNLSAHARKLEEARYVECRKATDGTAPKTTYGLTPTGRAALQAYLSHMEAIIRATRDAAAGSD